MTHLLLVVVAGCHLVAAEATSAEPVAGDFGQPVVVVPAPEDPRYAHLAWPKIVKTGDGTLVLAYSAGRFHGNGGEGCPAVSISTDEGQTFSPPHILREFDQTTEYDNSANTALGVAEDGTVVLLAMAYTGNERNSIFGWRTGDSAQTWTSVDTSNLADGKTGSVFGHIFPVPGKGLAVAGHFRPGSVTRTEGVWIAYSNDHGRTWGSPELITERRFFEPAIVLTRDRFVGLFRDPDTVSHYWLAVSDTKKMHWTITQWPERPPIECRLPCPFIVVSPRNPQRLYALESQRHMRGGVPGAVYLWMADAETLEWTRLGTVVEFPEELGRRRDITYPWMTHLEGDEWFLVFYCGENRGPSDIYGMRLTISEDEAP